MKTNRLLIIFSIIILSSCLKEQVPPGLLTKDEANIVSTTYITSTIPEAQTKHILFEEATGVKCANCPDGAKVLRDLKTQYPNKILSLSIYSEFLNNYQLPAKHDFNTEDAMALVNFIEGSDVSKPTSAINRLPTGDPAHDYFFKLNEWSSKVAAIKNETTPLNLELEVSPSDTANEYIVKATTTFTKTWTGDIALTICLLEDHIIDYQDSSFVKIPNYEHNHVLRKLITSAAGSPFKNANSTKERGRVFEKFATFTLPSNVLEKANCQILAYVHRTGSSKEVIHAQEVHLE